METIEKLNQTVESSAPVSLEAAEVWKKLIAFGGTEKFVPDFIDNVIVEGSGIGTIRRIQLKGGGEILERLTVANHENFEMKFVIISCPMPVENYEGSMTIMPKGNHCEVRFTSEYEVDEKNKTVMYSAIKGFQETFLSNLHR